jgi:cytochrome c nitrite reductase small subunit
MENLGHDKTAQVDEKQISNGKKNRKLGIWTIIGICAFVVLVLGGAGGGYLIHLSNTSPEFCMTCHIMKPNVISYLTSNDLDNVHYQAGVQCKECHDYPLSAEIVSGFNFVFGNYHVTDEGELWPVTYDDDMCLQCHISREHMGQSTDYLYRNPHKYHSGYPSCKTCHVSHGAQIDFCSGCHDNGNQRMVGEEYEPRGTIR